LWPGQRETRWASTREWFETVEEARRRARRHLPRSVYMALVAGTERGVTLRDNVAAFSELRFTRRTSATSPRPAAGHRRSSDRTSRCRSSRPRPGYRPCIPTARWSRARDGRGGNRSGPELLRQHAGGRRSGREPEPVLPGLLVREQGRDPCSGSSERAGRGQGLDRDSGLGRSPTAGDWAARPSRRRWTCGPSCGSPRKAWPAALRPSVAAGRRPARPHRAQHGRPREPAPTFFGVYGEWMQTPPPTWADLAWLREQWGGPFLVKGVMRADEARHCVDIGATAVSVTAGRPRARPYTSCRGAAVQQDLDWVPTRLLPTAARACNGAGCRQVVPPSWTRDGGGADIHAVAGLVGAHHALDQERAAPLLAQPGQSAQVGGGVCIHSP